MPTYPKCARSMNKNSYIFLYFQRASASYDSLWELADIDKQLETAALFWSPAIYPHSAAVPCRAFYDGWIKKLNEFEFSVLGFQRIKKCASARVLKITMEETALQMTGLYFWVTSFRYLPKSLTRCIGRHLRAGVRQDSADRGVVDC